MKFNRHSEEEVPFEIQMPTPQRILPYEKSLERVISQRMGNAHGPLRGETVLHGDWSHQI